MQHEPVGVALGRGEPGAGIGLAEVGTRLVHRPRRSQFSHVPVGRRGLAPVGGIVVGCGIQGRPGQLGRNALHHPGVAERHPVDFHGPAGQNDGVPLVDQLEARIEVVRREAVIALGQDRVLTHFHVHWSRNGVGVPFPVAQDTAAQVQGLKARIEQFYPLARIAPPLALGHELGDQDVARQARLGGRRRCAGPFQADLPPVQGAVRGGEGVVPADRGILHVGAWGRGLPGDQGDPVHVALRRRRLGARVGVAGIGLDALLVGFPRGAQFPRVAIFDGGRAPPVQDVVLCGVKGRGTQLRCNSLFHPVCGEGHPVDLHLAAGQHDFVLGVGQGEVVVHVIRRQTVVQRRVVAACQDH